MHVGVGVELCMCDSGAIVFSVYPAVYYNNVVFKNQAPPKNWRYIC